MSQDNKVEQHETGTFEHTEAQVCLVGEHWLSLRHDNKLTAINIPNQTCCLKTFWWIVQKIAGKTIL